MRQQQHRVLRLLAGALLGSDLTPKELMEISERLLFDPKWTERLAVYLRGIAEVSGSFSSKNREDFGYVRHDGLGDYANELVELFSRKQTRKNDALIVLKKASRSKKWKPQPSRTLRENCFELMRTFSREDDAVLLINRVADMLRIESDPYLRGLS